MTQNSLKIRVDDQGEWLEGIRQVISPNCDQRPENTAIDLLVIHSISLPPDEFGGDYIDRLFTNSLDPNHHPYFKEIASHKVSAHILINRQGVLTQYVPFTQRAWHAGESAFEGRANCNDYSIGIELEGCDDDAYDESQYSSLARVIKSLRIKYPDIDSDAITGHCDIAPLRKTDPGPAFDWLKLGNYLAD